MAVLLSPPLTLKGMVWVLLTSKEVVMAVMAINVEWRW